MPPVTTQLLELMIRPKNSDFLNKSVCIREWDMSLSRFSERRLIETRRDDRMQRTTPNMSPAGVQTRCVYEVKKVSALSSKFATICPRRTAGLTCPGRLARDGSRQ